LTLIYLIADYKYHIVYDNNNLAVLLSNPIYQRCTTAQFSASFDIIEKFKTYKIIIYNGI